MLAWQTSVFNQIHGSKPALDVACHVKPLNLRPLEKFIVLLNTIQYKQKTR
jgi:hypothetical protein